MFSPVITKIVKLTTKLGKSFHSNFMKLLISFHLLQKSDFYKCIINGLKNLNSQYVSFWMLSISMYILIPYFGRHSTALNSSMNHEIFATGI